MGRVAFSEFIADQPVAPTEGPNRWKPEVTCRAMIRAEIYHLIDAVVYGAKLIYEAGADGVDINGAYGGYMGDQFTTKAFNKRTDEFGGDMDGQLRVLTEIVKRIKKETAEYTEAGRDVEESIAMAKKLEEAGYDGFLMGNGAYDLFHWLYPPMYHKEGIWLDDFAPLTPEVNVPIIGAGKILQPETANDAIANGKVDAIAIVGVDKANVVTAIDVLLGKVSVGQNVVIIGGGQVGYEVGYDLLREGKNVAVVESLSGLIAGGSEPISAANVLILEDLLNFYKANDDLYQALNDSGKEIYLLGDAKQPSNIMHAVADGNKVGRTI